MRYFEDHVVGVEAWGIEEVASKEEMVDYALRYDPWPVHRDEEAASETPFGGLIASSGYAISLWYSSGNRGIWNRSDSTAAFIGLIDMKAKFPTPLRAGDTVRARSVINSKRLSSKPGRGIIEETAELINQDGDLVISAQLVYLVTTRP